MRLKKNTVKKKKNEVKLNLNDLKCSKSLKEITEYEIHNLLTRLNFISREHGLVPVIKAFNIQYEVREDLHHGK